MSKLTLLFSTLALATFGYSASIFPPPANLSKAGITTIEHWPKRTKQLSFSQYVVALKTVDPIRDEAGYDNLLANTPYFRSKLINLLVSKKYHSTEEGLNWILVIKEFPHPDSVGALLQLVSVPAFGVPAAFGVEGQTYWLNWRVFTSAQFKSLERLTKHKNKYIAEAASNALKNLSHQKAMEAR